MNKRPLKLLIAVVLLGSLTLTLDLDRGFYLKAAHAQSTGTLTISCIPPTQFTDGFPLLEQELDFYTFSCQHLLGTFVKEIDSIIGTRSDAVDISGLASGDYTCHLTVTTLLAAESGPSNTINFTIGPRVPMAPANLTSS